MKKIMYATLFALLAVLGLTGCANIDKNLLGDIKQPLVSTDPYSLGKFAGQGGYIAYGVCKGSGKNEDAVALCEEIWGKVQSGDGDLTVADVNNLALQMGGAALNDKYGSVYSYLILLAVQAAGRVADQAANDKLDTAAMNEFMRGVKDGVKLGQTIMPPSAFQPIEKPKTKAFDCPDGNCTVNVGSCGIKHQANIAQQLIDEGFVDKNEERADELTPTKYENLKHLIERCQILKKYKVEETTAYIKKFTCENGKLKDIEYRMVDSNGKEIVITCVACCTYPELDHIPVEELDF